jgi:hypothetical protein
MRLPSLPPLADGNLHRFLMLLVQALTENTKVTLTTEAPSANVLLSSPDGSVWSVKVDDAGALSATKLRDG